MRAVLTAALVVLLTLPASAQDKPDARRQWQDGTWGDTERVSTYVGSVANATATTTGLGKTKTR